MTVRDALTALARMDLSAEVWVDLGSGITSPLRAVVDETGGTSPRVLLVPSARAIMLTPARGLDDGEEEW